MKKWNFLTFLSFLLASSNASASEGYTWFAELNHFFHWGIPGHVLSFSLVALILIIVALVYRYKLSKVEDIVIPDKGITFRNIVEVYGIFIYSQCRLVLGEKLAPKYFRYISVIFLVIFISNFLGLIPGFLSPTQSLNTTFALGIFSFLFYNIKGCQEQGVINYFKHFAGPLWYMAVLIFPIEIISNLIRPISLALRLYGNMTGDHLLVATFTNLVPPLVPIPFYFLGLLVCFIQAYVFSMLSMVYISLASSHEGEEH